MNIYGNLKKSNEILENALLEQTDDHIDPLTILEGFQSSWKYIEKFLKNAHPEWAKQWGLRLTDIDHNELAFSRDMIKDAKQRIEKLKKERKVKNYFALYISLVGSLFTFNKSYEESCDICQSELRYYTDSIANRVLKRCSLCGTLYHGDTGVRIGLNEEISLRPSTKSDLIKEGIIDN
ncbi:hypothetical protein EBB07_31325 [Paenibacillaceae bacterium]|nr:hypothetical protein EBB07_31325 [Paenibacillaceae bacterium]